MAMKRCTKCVLPQTYPGITFNEEGVCNHCLTQEKKRDYYGEEALLHKIAPYRNVGNFDCIVGLSGGRDSSYVLYYAVKKLNLRVLAYTFDNGFMPEQTRVNIMAMTKKLGVEHIFEKRDHTGKCIRHFLLSWMHSPSPAMLSSMCVGCRLDMILGFLITARRHKIPLLLTGGGEPEQSFATEFLTTSSKRGAKTRSLLVGYAAELFRNPTYVLNPTFLATAMKEYFCCFAAFPLVRKLIYPEQKYVPFFRYIPWDEGKILSMITTELDWANYAYSKSTWRSDCKISLLKNYFYAETVGFTKNDELLSGMIRENQLTREEALGRLVEENVIPDQFVIEFFDELGLDYHKLVTASKGIVSLKQGKGDML